MKLLHQTNQNRMSPLEKQYNKNHSKGIKLFRLPTIINLLKILLKYLQSKGELVQLLQRKGKILDNLFKEVLKNRVTTNQLNAKNQGLCEPDPLI